MRALIVCPHFAPSNTADSHRMRMLLPYLARHGCHAEVLAVDPRDVRQAEDPWLEETLPADVPIHRVRALKVKGWGLNGLAQRAAIPLYRRGCDLLGRGRFDVVLFSTTRFLLYALGPPWKDRFGVPFCIDYQDPWVNDYYSRHPEVRPPGGRLKHGLADSIHRFAERYVVERCAGFLSVSPDYLTSLDERYGDLVHHQPRLVAQFPAEPREFDSLGDVVSCETPGSPGKVIRYVGRFVPNMKPAAELFFRTWNTMVAQSRVGVGALRFEAIGTSYYSNDSEARSLDRIADSCGVGSQVSEEPERISYAETLIRLKGADGLVVFGSDDPSYAASKIFPYIFARKPLLAILHERSPIVKVMQDIGGGLVHTIDGEIGCPSSTAPAVCQFLEDVVAGKPPVPIRGAQLGRFTAEHQAGVVVKWLRAAQK